MSATAEEAPATASIRLPWLDVQLQQLQQSTHHALLLEAPSGLGQWDMAWGLAKRWLCDTPIDQREQGAPCGSCASCHLLAANTHPDVFVLMPETTAMQLDWPLSPAAQADIDDKKRKPSKEIRADDALALVAFSQRTSARRQGKVALIYPAERMNTTSANSLLKVLEEPPEGLRFVLATDQSSPLLPTVRSRCQSAQLHWPLATVVQDWLQQHGVDASAAQVWLQASGGRPMDALALAQTGSPDAWQNLPRRLAQGDASALVELFGTEPLHWLQSLQKLCHDRLALHSGAAPRFFSGKALGQANSADPAALKRLLLWGEQLHQHSRQAKHPLKPELLLEVLGMQAQHAQAPAQRQG